MLTQQETIKLLGVEAGGESTFEFEAVIAPLTRQQRGHVCAQTFQGAMNDEAIRLGLVSLPGSPELVRPPLSGLYGGWDEKGLEAIEKAVGLAGYRRIATAIINTNVLSEFARKNSASPTP